MSIPILPQQTIKSDCIELNHQYSVDGNFMLDQIIIWEWSYDINNNRRKKVIDWLLLPSILYREQLSDEEFNKKNLEFARNWAKKFGIGTDVFAPKYTPKFLWGPNLPRYDYARKLWYVIVVRRKIVYYVYSNSFIETWTQYDPEVENQHIFHPDTRKGPFRKHPIFPE
jgi:hypothetical protein